MSDPSINVIPTVQGIKEQSYYFGGLQMIKINAWSRDLLHKCFDFRLMIFKGVTLQATNKKSNKSPPLSSPISWENSRPDWELSKSGLFLFMLKYEVILACLAGEVRFEYLAVTSIGTRSPLSGITS